MTDIFSSTKAIPTLDVVTSFFHNVELKRDGSGRFKSFCVFHVEGTPSFTVYQDGFHCYGCGAHGSNIDLLLKAGLAPSPLDAAKMIAEKFGIEVEQKKPRKQRLPTLSEYAAYVKLPEDFLVKTFHLQETPKGITFPYKDEAGHQVSVQIRHRLEKGKQKDNRFSWKEGKPYFYGAWAIPRWKEKETKRVILCEGASDIHVLWHNKLPALGIPGANNFKAEWATLLLNFPEIAIIQEPGKAGVRFVSDITAALKTADYQGQVKAVSLSEKDTRDLWLKHGERFKDELETAIAGTEPMDLEAIQTTGKGKSKAIPPELENRLIHPALHIEPGFSTIGVINRVKNKNVFSIITSTGNRYLEETIRDVLSTRTISHPGLSGRWKQSGKVQTLSDSVALLIQKLRELVWFEDKRWYPAISLWGAGTYLFLAFPAYPYLQLTGEKGSGKTKVQDILECVAFNAIKVIDITPAVLFRVVQALRPTFLLDEAESLNTKEAIELRGIVNAGYKQGASVGRCEGEDRQPKFFEVYSPKCLAAIRSLGTTTEDRCIVAVMSKPPQRDYRQNRAVDPLDTDWPTIRDGFYQLPLNYRDRVLQPDTQKLPNWLNARDRELWGPLLRLASIVDEESSLGISEDVLGLARDSVKERGLTFETDTILGLLESMLDGQETLTVHPVDLTTELQRSLNRQRISPEWVAARLRGLGFKKANPPRDKDGVIYEIKAEKLSDIRCRYTPPEQPTDLHTEQPTQP